MMTTLTKQPATKNFWQGTNFWNGLILFLINVFILVNPDIESQIALWIDGTAGMLLLIRQAVKSGVRPIKEILADSNTVAYLAMVLSAIGIEGVGQFIPAVQELLSAIASGNFTAIVSAGITLIVLVYNLFIKGAVKQLKEPVPINKAA